MCRIKTECGLFSIKVVQTSNLNWTSWRHCLDKILLLVELIKLCIGPLAAQRCKKIEKKGLTNSFCFFPLNFRFFSSPRPLLQLTTNKFSHFCLKFVSEEKETGHGVQFKETACRYLSCNWLLRPKFYFRPHHLLFAHSNSDAAFTYWTF